MNDSWTLMKLNPLCQERYVDHVRDSLPNIPIYFPRYMDIRRPHRCRTPIKRELPVYPGYVFCRIDLKTDSIHSLISTPYRVYFVRFGSQISIVPDSVINDLKRKESLNQLVRETIIQDPYQPGRKVRVHLPIADIEGIICKALGQSRLVIDTSIGLATVYRHQAALIGDISTP